ncbi:MAG: hypothetical protein JXM73_07965 [Anaerolineae bacterium]|nr:hypothetical protein [Anaerolineae bacterium]
MTDYEADIYSTSGIYINNGFMPAATFGCSGGGVCRYTTSLPAGTYYSRLRAVDTVPPVCSVSIWSQSGNVPLETCVNHNPILNPVDGGLELRNGDNELVPAESDGKNHNHDPAFRGDSGLIENEVVFRLDVVDSDGADEIENVWFRIDTGTSMSATNSGLVSTPKEQR